MRQESNDLKNLRLWLRECPFLPKKNPLRVDFIGDEEEEYSIQQSPSAIQYRENVLGEMVPLERQNLNFSLRFRLPFGQDVNQNIANSGFCQAVCAWIQEKNVKREFPKISEGLVIGLVPSLSPYVAEAGPDSAIYQIQMQITYKTN